MIELSLDQYRAMLKNEKQLVRRVQLLKGRVRELEEALEESTESKAGGLQRSEKESPVVYDANPILHDKVK